VSKNAFRGNDVFGDSTLDFSDVDGGKGRIESVMALAAEARTDLLNFQNDVGRPVNRGNAFGRMGAVCLLTENPDVLGRLLCSILYCRVARDVIQFCREDPDGTITRSTSGGH
jgi:hypothetical protein